jgi:tetratricopeptide (TPR) repeat protein
VLKALQPEPARRYSSADALAEDLRRWLAGRTVVARPDTALYRLRKFARRHRVGLASAALVVLALVIGAISTLRESRRAHAAESQAERRFDDVRDLANSMLFEVHDAIRDLPGATQARALLVRRALDYLDHLSREAATDRRLLRELSAAYQKVGDVQGNPFMSNLGDLPGAVASYGKAIDLLEPLVAGESSSDGERETLARALLFGAGIRVAAGEASAAVPMSERGLALRRDLAASSPQDRQRRLDLAQALQFHGFNLWATMRHEEALRALDEQSGLLAELLAANPADREAQRSLGQNRYLSGQWNDLRGNSELGLEALGEAADVQRELWQSAPDSMTFRRDLVYTLQALGHHHSVLGDYAGAFEDFEQALELSRAMSAADSESTDGRLSVAISLFNTAIALGELGRAPEALARYAESKGLYEQSFAPASKNAWAIQQLGALYVDAGLELERAQRASLTLDPLVLQQLGSPCELFRQALATFDSLGSDFAPEESSEKERRQAEEGLARCKANGQH